MAEFRTRGRFPVCWYFFLLFHISICRKHLVLLQLLIKYSRQSPVVVPWIFTLVSVTIIYLYYQEWSGTFHLHSPQLLLLPRVIWHYSSSFSLITFIIKSYLAIVIFILLDYFYYQELSGTNYYQELSDTNYYQELTGTSHLLSQFL